MDNDHENDFVFVAKGDFSQFPFPGWHKQTLLSNIIAFFLVISTKNKKHLRVQNGTENGRCIGLSTLHIGIEISCRS